VKKKLKKIKIRIPCQEINSLKVQLWIEAVPIFCAA